MKRTATITTLAVAAAASAGCGSSDKQSSAKPTHAPDGRATSSIAEGAQLARPVVWKADATGVPPSDIVAVRFLIDGKVKHVEQESPYVFEGDGNRLLPGTLGAGSHSFGVDVKLASGSRLTAAATATVTRAAQGVPKEVVGRWHRRVSAAEVRRTERFRRAENGDPLPTGTWTVRIGADAVARYIDPFARSDSLTVGQVRFERGGRLVVGSEIPNFPGGQGYFCPDTGPGRYRWSVSGGALVVRAVKDHECADRNSFWTGTFTR